jgi:hypothetical protein
LFLPDLLMHLGQKNLSGTSIGFIPTHPKWYHKSQLSHRIQSSYG